MQWNHSGKLHNDNIRYEGQSLHTALITVTVQSGSVGGVVLPVDKLRLLTPFLAGTLILVVVTTGIVLMWIRKRQIVLVS